MPDGLPSAKILAAQFNRPPKEVIAFFQKKGNRLGAKHWDWSDTMRHAHDRAFVVAKVASLDVLKDIRGAMTEALQQGHSFASFEKNLAPTLQAKGWWGKQEVTDPRTGEVKLTQLGSHRRLETIYTTNMTQNYQAGHYAKDMEVAEDMPFWTYKALHGGHRRPEHQLLDGLTFRYDDAFWATHHPSQGFGCKCYKETGDEADVKRNGRTVIASRPEDFHTRTFLVQGKEVPVIGYKPPGSDTVVYPQPSFDYCPGDLSWRTKQLLVDRLDELPNGAVREAFQQHLHGALQEDFELYLKVLDETAITRKEVLAVGVMDDETTKALASKTFRTKEGSLTLTLATPLLLAANDKLEHALRDSKASKGIDMPVELLSQLPTLLQGYEMRWDKQKGGLLFFSPPFKDGSKSYRWKVVFNPWIAPQGHQLRFSTATKVDATAISLGEVLR